MSRLKEQYENEIVPALKKKFEYKNPMEEGRRPVRRRRLFRFGISTAIPPYIF